MEFMEKVNRLNHQLNRLQARHKKLKSRIRQEMKRPKPDELTLQKLKRLRLKTKDGIMKIMLSTNRENLETVSQTA